MSIKTDNTQTLVNALEEIERLRGRVATQEDALYSIAVALKDAGNLSREMHDLIVTANQGSANAWLLRKQAEALLAVSDEIGEGTYQRIAKSRLRATARRFYDKADAIEKGERDE